MEVSGVVIIYITTSLARTRDRSELAGSRRPSPEWIESGDIATEFSQPDRATALNFRPPYHTHPHIEPAARSHHPETDISVNHVSTSQSTSHQLVRHTSQRRATLHRGGRIVPMSQNRTSRNADVRLQTTQHGARDVTSR